MTEKSEKSDKAEKIEKRWKKVQEHLGFTDEEIALFRSHPNHVKAMERAPLFATHEIVIEVIESHNCAAGYQVGDQFVIDAEGILIPEKSPSKLCVAAIFSFKPLVDRMWQAFYNNSTEILHDTVHCPDVGVRQGGTGSVTLRGRAILKGNAKKDNPER
jgi:uncharacterized repeat protein (TIGR04076 family)